MAARTAVAVVAVLVVAWLGVMERDAREHQLGIAAAQHPLEPASFASADSHLRAARLLNPDTAPDVTRAVLYYAGRRPAAAGALLRDVLRREPDNLSAWATLYLLTRQRDPALARSALAARRRLDPVGAGAR